MICNCIMMMLRQTARNLNIKRQGSLSYQCYATQRTVQNIQPVQEGVHGIQRRNKDWLDFEYYAMDFHKATYGHQVWHTTEIPEAILSEAGVIHPFNQKRITTIARERQRKGKHVIFDDYGIDFLARHVTACGDVMYHACQAKHYRTKPVRAKDIGTFLVVLMAQTKNTGYLYTTGELEMNLHENIGNMGPIPIIHHMLDFPK